jgi:uncharacterized protein DUF1549/uncharacterized protein DUF1553/cytochrome c
MLGNLRIFLELGVLVCAVLVPAWAAETDAGRLYSETIQPVMKEKCLGCHGVGNIFASLDLRTREAMLKGGGRGPAVVPGDASASLLYKALEHQAGPALMMPPGSKLPEETRTAFRNWIDTGAPFIEVQEAGFEWGKFEKDDLWAFYPLQDVTPPEIDTADSAVDAFIQRKLRERGLEPGPAADRRTLIRRATIDLTGLLPSPEDVDAFVDDAAPEREAFAKVVDRLLSSPQYGERWGRHWLDVARYADTGGYSNDFERPNAWRYRDYVIRAFNDDKPYDRFILEQIAGDELYPDNSEAAIAVGFLRSGPWEHTGMSVAAETRQLWLDDVTHSTVTAFLGVTMGCAKCHDHKFDPLPQKDYYRVQAVFATSAFARRKVDFLEVERRDGFEDGKARFDMLVEQVRTKLAEIEALNKQRLFAKYNITDLNDLPEGVGKKSGLTPEEKEGEKLYRKHLSLQQLSAERYEPLTLSVSSGLLPEANDITPGGEKSYLKKPDYETAETHLLVGGSIQSPGEKVTPGVLGAIEEYSGYPAPEIPETVAGRRSALARWIAHKDNPLTARVMVNRIWQYHFGSALAGNANNFGKMGKKPTHPELLDWLAGKFIEGGWRLKPLHRQIMLSDVYMRSSNHPTADDLAEKDPDNYYLAYFTPRRVEAEVLRDAMLAVADELSPAAGGPGTYPQINRSVADQPRHAMGSLRPAYWAEPTKAARNRRSIYSFQQRSLIDPLVEVFNGPPLDMSCEQRDATTVPTQAFSLFNSELSYDLALVFAARLSREADDNAARIERAFRLAYGRTPTAEERDASLAHIADLTEYHRTTPPVEKPEQKPLLRSITSELTGEIFNFQEERPPWQSEENLQPRDVDPETRALADLALVIFNSNEFAYIY